MTEENNIDLDAELEEALDESTPKKVSVPKKLVTKDTEASTTSDSDEASTGEDKHKKAADPFARLAKKKVAKPKSMNDIMKKKVKKGGKVSPKVFLLGCGVFFILMLGMMFGGLYYAVSSAGVLESIGLQIDDVKTILMIFAILFFGLIFFLAFYILVLNVYRLVTAKGKKIKYVLGLILGLLLLVGVIVLGTMSIQKIRGLSGKEIIQSTNLVLTYVETRDGDVFAEDGIPLIAPLRMNFKLNTNSGADITRDIVQSMERRQPYPVQLDCGNGQRLQMTQNGEFNGNCFFLNKEQYDFSLIVETPDGEKTYPAAGFTPQAVINLKAIEDESRYNDNLTEYVIGIAPVTVEFRGQNLFTDLGLSDDVIQWDLDGDKQLDLEDNAAFEHAYTDSKLHTVSYRLPELGKFADTWYTFDLRVVESELARCSLNIEEIDSKRNTRRVTPSFDEAIRPASYHYIVTDTANDNIVEKRKETKDSSLFDLPSGGIYEISASYFTNDGKKGPCTSETIDIGFDGNQVAFDLKWKQRDDEPYISIGEGTPIQLDDSEKQITINTIPAILEFTITDIQPDPTADLKVIFEEKQLFPVADDIYELELSTLGTKELIFALETKQGKKSQQVYTIDVSRSSVRAAIQVEPDTVGEDPFNVILDASVSSLYNEEDEIVYFTWDFGDGETRENISQGKVTHQYLFDKEANTGEYYPSVTVTTKLGFTDTYRMETPITVKRKQKEVLVRADSHPTQQVKVGEKVDFSVETDGLIKRIDWNFGDQKTFGCDDRSCSQTSHRYETPGEQEVRVEVQYESDVPVVGRLKIKVYK